MTTGVYRGRLAPSPTGYLHRGHACTFWVAQQRAKNGTLILRNDDLDRSRVRPEFVAAMLEDMRWLGLHWSEIYTQSERLPLYRETFERLKASGHLFPCICSRKDVLTAAGAPHMGEDEPVYPGTCRRTKDEVRSAKSEHERAPALRTSHLALRTSPNWRFRVPDGEVLTFNDGHFGEQRATCGVDFGDFLVWRKDDLPSYQLACVVDDALMQITEVVRGADLVASTFRQILLYRALGWTPPAFYHCPLVLDDTGHRLAKRDASTTLRGLREAGWTPAQILVEPTA